jgi:hypothetical protein
VADGDQENGGLACSVRREETDHIVVVKGEAGGAQPLRVNP